MEHDGGNTELFTAYPGRPLERLGDGGVNSISHFSVTVHNWDPSNSDQAVQLITGSIRNSTCLQHINIFFASRLRSVFSHRLAALVMDAAAANANSASVSVFLQRLSPVHVRPSLVEMLSTPAARLLVQKVKLSPAGADQVLHPQDIQALGVALSQLTNLRELSSWVGDLSMLRYMAEADDPTCRIQDLVVEAESHLEGLAAFLGSTVAAGLNNLELYMEGRTNLANIATLGQALNDHSAISNFKVYYSRASGAGSTQAFANFLQQLNRPLELDLVFDGDEELPFLTRTTMFQTIQNQRHIKKLAIDFCMEDADGTPLLEATLREIVSLNEGLWELQYRCDQDGASYNQSHVQGIAEGLRRRWQRGQDGLRVLCLVIDGPLDYLTPLVDVLLDDTLPPPGAGQRSVLQKLELQLSIEDFLANQDAVFRLIGSHRCPMTAFSLAVRVQNDDDRLVDARRQFAMVLESNKSLETVSAVLPTGASDLAFERSIQTSVTRNRVAKIVHRFDTGELGHEDVGTTLDEVEAVCNEHDFDVKRKDGFLLTVIYSCIKNSRQRAEIFGRLARIN